MINPSNIKAVFWDIDGTLIDSEELHFSVLVEQCARHGLFLKPEDNDRLLGATMDDKWRIISTLHDFPFGPGAWRREFTLKYAERINKNMGFPERLAVVRDLQKRNIRQACVSNGDRDLAQINLKTLGVEDYFEFIIAGGDCPQGKPHPAPYLAACRAMGLPPEQCLAVEDSTVGAQAALAAGLLTVVWANTPTWRGPNPHHLIKDNNFPWELLLEKDIAL